MSGAAAATVDQGGQGAGLSMGEELTQAERDYMNSRGENLSGFNQPDQGGGPGGNDNGPDNAPPGGAAAGQDGQQAAESDDDDFEAGGPQRDSQGRFVKREAFLRVKEKAKVAAEKATATETQMQQLQSRVSELFEGTGLTERINETLRQMAAQRQQAQPGTDDQGGAGVKPIPKAEEDLFGAVNALVERLQTLDQAEQKRQAETKEQQATRELMERVNADEARFVQQKPDYVDAKRFLANARYKQLELLGYSGPQIAQQLDAEERAAAAAALKTGKSPAEFMYGYAQTFGYQPKAPGAGGQAQQPAAGGQGGAQRIQQINNGQRAAASLSGSGATPGGAGGGDLLGKLLAMNDSDFAAFRADFIKQNGREKWNAETGLG